MALDLATLVDPGHTTLVTQECQNGVIGARAVVPDLAAAAGNGMVAACARLAAGARAAGVAVVHCVAARRADGRGSNHNARLFAAMARRPVKLLPGSAEVDVIPEIGVAETDLVLTRLHGLGPMAGTELDPVLRNLGTRTVVAVGVSVNIGLLDLVFDAVNAGYQVVVPRDAVAGVPPDYVGAVIDHTISLVATVVDSADVVAAWGQ